MKQSDRERIAHWVEKHLDDSIQPEEFEQLERLLIEDPEAQHLYLELMQLNAQLKLEGALLSAASLSTGRIEGEVDRGNQVNLLPRRMYWPSVLAVAASLVLLVTWRLNSGGENPAQNVIAEIKSSSGAQWGDCSLPTSVGSSLIAGQLQLERGIATIRFLSGASITLESPAMVEIENAMSARLLAGTAVVEVPKSAYGFTVETPNAVAVDHGTAFAVTVDASTQRSAIEVLEGEVEVQHIGSQSSRRLKVKQRVVASQEALSELLSSSDEPHLIQSESTTPSQNRLLRISTADGQGSDATVVKSEAEVQDIENADLVMIKNPFRGYEGFSRKGYFRFDLSALAVDRIKSVKLQLTLQPTGLGFASRVGDCRFLVFGLHDNFDVEWRDGILDWNSAPGNSDDSASMELDKVIELGEFVVKRGVQNGQVQVDGQRLVDFLKKDSNQSVTIVVVRETPEDSPGGLVHGFCSHRSTAGSPPTLFVETAAAADEQQIK